MPDKIGCSAIRSSLIGGRKGRVIIYPKECGICNSGKISACDECEQTLSFSCDRCNGMFEVEKPFHDRSLWWNSKRICNLCGLNKATIDDGVNDICNECNFNQQQKAERITHENTNK